MVLSMDRWVGKVAIVTGASSGIGKAIAEQLVEAGLKVVGLARRDDRLEEIKKKLSAKKGSFYSFKCDVANESNIIEAFQWVEENVGPISILVNNAGIANNSSLSEGDSKIWKQIFDVNVLGLCIATREAVKSMKTHNIDGHIIHINSIAGHKVPNYPNTNVYPASKHAVTALTETLRAEFVLNEVKIKVTSISPGYVTTEILKVANFDMNLVEKLPALKAEDIADGVIYTLSTPQHVQVHELTIKPIGEVF